MGRTIATFRDLIEQELVSWKRVFGRALRQEERAYLETMFNRVRLYAQACTYQFPVHAMDGIDVAIALDHEIRLRRIEALLGINLKLNGWLSRPLPVTRRDDAVADSVQRTGAGRKRLRLIDSSFSLAFTCMGLKSSCAAWRRRWPRARRAGPPARSRSGTTSGTGGSRCPSSFRPLSHPVRAPGAIRPPLGFKP